MKGTAHIHSIGVSRNLGDIASFINGFAFKPEDWTDEGLPIMRIQDLTGSFYQANRYNGAYDKRYEVHSGDILISWSASLGIYVWQGETAVLNQHIFKVVFDKEEVNKSFFIHQVRHVLENAMSHAHGATMKHLTRPVFNALPFCLPQMQEQNSIAKILDFLTKLIRSMRQGILRTFTFSDVELDWIPGGKPVPAPEECGEGTYDSAPAPFYWENVNDARMENCAIRWKTDDPGWTNGAWFRQCTKTETYRCRLGKNVKED